MARMFFAHQIVRSGLRGRAKEWFEELTEVDHSWSNLKYARYLKVQGTLRICRVSCALLFRPL